MKSLITLRLFGFLILDTTATAARSGARYTNSSTTRSSGEASSGSAGAIGDYIASGLGLVHGSSSSIVLNAALPDRAETTASAHTLSTGHNGTNATDQCWARWADYWHMSDKISSMFTTFTKEITAYDYTYSYSVWPVTTTETQGNGNFPTKTVETTLTTSSQVWRTISDSNSTTSMVVTTRVSNTLTPPPCSLPSYVPDCQSSWVAWGNSGAHNYLGRPPCTQASVPKSLCDTVMSKWLASERGEAGEVGGKIGLDLTQVTVNGTTSMSSSWPTSSTLAPGCTVGCQSCRVSGSRVKLLYWPPEATTWRNGTFIATTSKANGVVTAKAYGTTLTSPTVYISFDKLHASNSCKVLGSTMSNIIVAVTDSATLSSLYGWGRYWGMQETASFNFTDLYVTPVPHSIYMSQPRCASSSNSLLYSCLKYGTSTPAACQTENTPLLCATTLPYEPVISVPREVQQLQPDWEGCIGGIIGVYDPPSALTEATVEDKPTLPIAAGSSTAQTTKHTGSGPDATTAASPSPTFASVPSPTRSPVIETSSQADPTDLPNNEQPASDGPIQSTTNGEPASESPQTNDPAKADPDPSRSDLPVGTDQTIATSSPVDALDVLTAAQTQSLEQEPAPTDTDPKVDPPANINGATSLTSNTETALLIFTFDPTTTIDTGSADSPLVTYDPSTKPIDHPATSTQTYEPLAIITASEQTATAIQSGSRIIIFDASNTQTLAPGQTTIIDSTQTLRFEPSHGLVVGDSTIPLNDAPPTQAAAIWTANNGHTFSAIPQQSNIIIIAGPDSTGTLTQGATVLAGGQTISLLPSSGGAGLVADGSSTLDLDRTAEITSLPVIATGNSSSASSSSLTAASTTSSAESGSQSQGANSPENTATATSGSPKTFTNNWICTGIEAALLCMARMLL